MARDDYAKALIVERWPVVEVLHSFMGLLRERALLNYQQSVMVWAMLAPHQKDKSQPPKPPSILND